MQLGLTLSLICGILGVVQAGINRNMTAQMGMAGAMLINGLTLMFYCLIFYFIKCLYPDLIHQLFPPSEKALTVSMWKTLGENLWFLLPGLMGFCIVMFVPVAIGRIGALTAFIGVVATQLVTSMFWDYYVEKLPPGLFKVLGALLALLGVVLSTWKSGTV